MRRLKLALSPYRQYLDEDENFRKWAKALERPDGCSVGLVPTNIPARLGTAV